MSSVIRVKTAGSQHRRRYHVKATKGLRKKRACSLDWNARPTHRRLAILKVLKDMIMLRSPC